MKMFTEEICDGEINYWTSGKICAKVAFPRYTESVKFRSQIRETASKRKQYRGLQPWTKIMAKWQTIGDFLDTTSNATLFLETIWSA